MANFLAPSAELLSPEAWTPEEFGRVLGNVPAAAYVCDQDGLITYFNRRAAEIWGREPLLNDPRDRYCGSSRIFTRDGAPLSHEKCWMARALMEDREFNGYELVIEQPSGKRVTALAHATPVHGQDGALLGAVNVIVDISDQRRKEAIKDEFLAGLGHELRNPLGPVRNALHILKSRGLQDTQSNWALDLIETQVAELVALIESVSDVSRLSRGGVSLQPIPCDVQGLIAAAVTKAGEYLERKQQTVEPEFEHGPMLVNGDRALLEKAIAAAIRHASRMARSRHSVHVRSSAGEGTWRLSIGPEAESDDVAATASNDIASNRTTAQRETTVDLALIREIFLAHGGVSNLCLNTGNLDLALPLTRQ